MKYIVQAIDANKVTTSGKAYHKVTLASGSELHEGVAIWSDFPNFNSITFEAEVEGDVVIKQNGQYVNKTLYAPKGPANRTTGGSRGGQTAIREGVREAQENKDWAIMTSSTFRDATAITIAQFGGQTVSDEDFKAEWKAWRLWLAKNWDVDEKDLKNPF